MMENYDKSFVRIVFPKRGLMPFVFLAKLCFKQVGVQHELVNLLLVEATNGPFSVRCGKLLYRRSDGRRGWSRCNSRRLSRSRGSLWGHFLFVRPFHVKSTDTFDLKLTCFTFFTKAAASLLPPSSRYD